jgi:asparagine synthase (glutamine-hydrolysing)
MCGIAGLWQNQKSIDPSEFSSFVDALAHRGPDGRGEYWDRKSNLALGHRRLSILDLSDEARHPMASPDRRYQIILNGEIYNFLELRKELEDLGHNFHTQSDTEVLLHAYMQWGQDCQSRLNGMWAFAIWDSVEQSLFLSRDRFGVKPLLFINDPQYFAFASEAKAFLALSQFQLQWNDGVAVRAMQAPSSIEGGVQGILKHVQRLRPGHCGLFRPGGDFNVRRWWKTADHIQSLQLSKSEQIQKFREIWFDACRIRMRSDVPTAVSLSGGLDSSAVLVTLNKLQDSDQGLNRTYRTRKAFIASFPGTIQDEVKHALQVVQAADFEPRIYDVNARSAMSEIDTILFHTEEIYEPCVGPWEIYKQFRCAGVPISIDGHGGDELLFGYHHFAQMALQESILNRNPLAAYGFAKLLEDMYSESNGRAATDYFVKTLKHTAKEEVLNGIRSIPVLSRVLRRLRHLQNSIASQPAESLWETPAEPLFEANEVWEEARLAFPADLVSQRLYVDFHLMTLPTILRNFDRMSMAHGVEVREPFLDWRLVVFCFSLPRESKVSERGTKLILREALHEELPAKIRDRKSKIGFASPMKDWLKDRSFQNYLLDISGSKFFLETGLWNARHMKRQLEGSLRPEGAALRTDILYCLLGAQTFELFRRKQISYANTSQARKSVDSHRIEFRENGASL